jgi:hypothetical protein
MSEELKLTRDGRPIRQFRNHAVALRYVEYGNKRIAIMAYTVKAGRDDEPDFVATVNLPEVPMAIDEVAVKDYSENEGMLDWLVSHGIVSEPVRYVGSGFSTIPICKLLKGEKTQ